MKHWALRICVFLLLGAIVNVAVAWGCTAQRLPPRWFEQWLGPFEEPPADWQTREPYFYSGETGFGIKQQSWGYSPDEFGSCLRTVVSAGWPSVAFRCRSAELSPIGEPWTLEWSLIASEPFPLWPIWPGFAINTLFYAAILWLLFAAPFALRRRRRLKRGLCPACAYPVGDSEVCTECGWPVRPEGQPSVRTASERFSISGRR